MEKQTSRADKLAGLLEQCESMLQLLGQSKWALQDLIAIRDWALAQQPIKVGDRVRIAEHYTVPQYLKDGHWNGYWSFRECLAPGATGTVTEVYYNSAYKCWSACAVIDKQWIISSHDGTRIDVDQKYQFNFRIEDLEAIVDVPPREAVS